MKEEAIKALADKIMKKHIPNGCINLKGYDAEKAAIISAMCEMNAPKEPVIDSLRDKFFSECVSEELFHDHDPLQRIHFELTYRPDDLFEWFKPYLKSNTEPVIDWEGLTQDLNQFYNEAWNDGVESSAVYEKATVHIPEERISQFLNRLPNYLKPENSQPTADPSDSNQNSLT